MPYFRAVKLSKTKLQLYAQKSNAKFHVLELDSFSVSDLQADLRGLNDLQIMCNSTHRK